MVMLLGLVVAVFAQKPAVVLSDEPGWHKIGQITASFETETESIIVLGSDEFRSIKLKATDGPLNIDRVQVHYESGEIEDMEVDHQLQAGAETEELHLQYPDKEVQKVSFTYHTAPNYREEKATVELYGFKAGDEGDDNNASNRLRDDADDVRDDVNRETREIGDDIDRNIDEADDDIKRESREAQDGANRTGEDLKDGFNRTTEVIGAEITDEVYHDKVGPHGERIYIDDQSNFYYIDKEGKKVSITEARMRDNPNRDRDNNDQ